MACFSDSVAGPPSPLSFQLLREGPQVPSLRPRRGRDLPATDIAFGCGRPRRRRRPFLPVFSLSGRGVVMAVFTQVPGCGVPVAMQRDAPLSRECGCAATHAYDVPGSVSSPHSRWRAKPVPLRGMLQGPSAGPRSCPSPPWPDEAPRWPSPRKSRDAGFPRPVAMQRDAPDHGDADRRDTCPTPFRAPCQVPVPDGAPSPHRSAACCKALPRGPRPRPSSPWPDEAP
jgi:hypothetical protein